MCPKFGSHITNSLQLSFYSINFFKVSDLNLENILLEEQKNTLQFHLLPSVISSKLLTA